MDYGLIVDVETTGMDPETDAIIELGILQFAVNADSVPAITQLYGALEDPGRPIPPEIVKLTGLNDKLVRGHKIDWTHARQLFDEASMVIAHNAAFDRSFLMRRPELEGINAHWACSIRHIDWDGKGFRSRALNYLAADHGFVNPFAHRALFDCAMTFRVIAPYFSELLTRSYLQDVRVWATGAPFESKDRLREARYRWEPQQRAWFKDILEDGLDQEREFLRSSVYPAGRDTHREEVLSL